MDPHGDADTVGWICSKSSLGSDIRRCSTILPPAIRSTWTAVNVTRFPVAGIPWNAPVWVPWNRPTVTTWSPSATMLSFTYRPSGNEAYSSARPRRNPARSNRGTPGARPTNSGRGGRLGPSGRVLHRISARSPCCVRWRPVAAPRCRFAWARYRGGGIWGRVNRDFRFGEPLSAPSPSAGSVDAKDFRLLVALHEDARASYRALGRRVSLSAPAVRDRLRRLEGRGIFQGYMISVDPSLLDRDELLVFFQGEWTREGAREALAVPDVAWVAWKLDGGLSVQTWPRDRARTVRELTARLGTKPSGQALGAVFLINELQEPPTRFLLCRGIDLGDVTTRIARVGKLPGIASVNVSLNREIILSPDLLRHLVRERIEKG